MPLVYYNKISNGLELGIWHITESVDELLKYLYLNKEEFATLYSFKSEKRKKQWMSYRALIRTLVQTDFIYRIYYDENNKPYLVNPPRSISVSHTDNYSAVLINENVNEIRGLDVERLSEKAFRNKNKFLTDEEINLLPIDNLYFYSTLFWSAKESVYKKSNIPNIFLKSNIKIENIDFENNIINAKLFYKDIIVEINVFWSIYDSMVITYTD
ncbi:MAG TPA: 4'-phosphopantetheinyl transferase superfamily protein [Bacteroidales bacterium]|nr:4'-phosphopantetheinyl transferase superfamily protein [Bacteroidales bacterium]HOL74257.1 4'-phosphopantetheinyl transferase superfamily protein [Bacteroidales bacterium]